MTGQRKIVSGKQERCARRAERGEQVEQLDGGGLVNSAERFVEQHNRSLLSKRSGDVRALQLSARQFGQRARLVSREVHCSERFAGRSAIGGRCALMPRTKSTTASHDQLAHCDGEEQIGFAALRDIRNVHSVDSIVTVNAVHIYFARMIHQTTNGFEQGALASTIGPDDTNQLTRAHREGDVAKRLAVAVANAYIVQFQDCVAVRVAHEQASPFSRAARFDCIKET